VIRRTAWLVALSLALAAPAARAQDASAASLEDPRAARFNDVERGFFIGLEAGWVGLFSTPTKDPARFPYAGDGGGASGGLAVGLHAGVDLGSRLALSVFALGSTQKASTSYGAFDVMAAGLDLRASVWATRDRNGWERLFAWVHARAGYALTHPEGLFGDSDLLVGAGGGIEYYTQLRHFSVGLQLDLLYTVEAGALGVGVAPVVRYTF
jgi:hypothetical protein